MVEKVSCPNCRFGLHLPSERLGRYVHCPRCDHVFLAGSRDDNHAAGVTTEPCAPSVGTFETGEDTPFGRQVEPSPPIPGTPRGSGLAVASVSCAAIGVFFTLPLALGLLGIPLPDQLLVAFGCPAICLSFLVIPVLILAVIFGFIAVIRQREIVMGFLGATGLAGIWVEIFFWSSRSVPWSH